MKLIINIPEDIYKNKNYIDYFGCSSLTLADVIENGTPIPDNATNGDVIDAMFSNVDFVTDVFGGFNFPKWWWNAPYQKGGK